MGSSNMLLPIDYYFYIMKGRGYYEKRREHGII